MSWGNNGYAWDGSGKWIDCGSCSWIYSNLEVRGNGGEFRNDLKRERDAICNSPLDEGPGESFHRATNMTMQQAAASRLPWVMTSVRQSQDYETCSNFVNSAGDESPKVFRFEFQNFKRILRPTSKDAYKPMKMTDEVFFFRTLYRLDGDDDDWSAVAKVTSNAPMPRAPGAAPPARVVTGYLQSVFKEESVYSVPVARAEEQGDGLATTVYRPMYFQVSDAIKGPYERE
jgi:hypothetical protein